MINPASGWNTWDYECLTALSYVDGDRVEVQVRVSVFDEERCEHIADTRWRDLVRLGPHAVDGSYLQIEYQAGFEARFVLEAASRGEALYLRVRPTRTSAKRIVVEVRRPGRSTACARSDDGMDFGDWALRAEGVLPHNRFVVWTDGPNVVGYPGEAVSVIVAPSGDAALAGGGVAQAVADALAAGRERHEASRPRLAGDLGEAVEAMLRAAAWNTLYDISGRGVCTTASRDWCKDWHGVVLFGWDTYFHGLIAGVASPETAWANYRASLAGATDEGFVPNWRLSNGVGTLDRSQPPVGALCVWQTHLRGPNPEALRELYPKLKRWHDWWMGARGTAEGLLAWGSDPRAAYAFPQFRQRMYGAQICGCYESGMDNSPMFDGVPYDRETGRMLQADVGLTALYTVDAQCLAAMARELGLTDDAAALDAEAAAMRERMDALMWDEAAGVCRNRRADGTLSPRLSPTSFYPLLCADPADAAAMARAGRLVREHLLNPDEFWGEYPLPSVPRSDPDFRDNDYWRGRIWAPMVYLVHQGLLRVGPREVAHDLAERSLRMFLRNWRERGAVYENYNATTGDGGDVHNADPLYVWGGLLALVGLADAEAG